MCPDIGRRIDSRVAMRGDATVATADRLKRGRAMKSLVLKRSVIIGGHKTSVSLEDPFCKALKEIRTARDITLSELIASIDEGRNGNGNLSSAIRLFVLDHYLNKPDETVPAQGHRGPLQALSGA
jgi:predicted DNA-binding ribbon-helix-helix protein